MGAVFGTQIGLSAAQIALFVAMLFAGALVLQYPIGWLSDRVDRRKLIFGAAVVGAASCALGWINGGGLWPLMAAAFLAGGVTTPLYALFLAYTNDFLSAEDMPAASGGLVFTFGLGAIAGPLITGSAMQQLGPFAFWLVLGATFGAIALDPLGGRDRKLPGCAAHSLALYGGGGGCLGCRTSPGRTQCRSSVLMAAI
jgi:MFS family permease